MTALRAVRLVASWAFAQAQLTRLEICVTASGVHGLASRLVAEQAGFRSAGLRRSHIPATGLQYEDPLYILNRSHDGIHMGHAASHAGFTAALM